MKLTACHDITDIRHRSPFGAVRAGERVLLAVALKGLSGGETVWLRIWDGTEKRIPTAGKNGLFSAEFTPPNAGIYWYRFEIRRGERLFFCAPGPELIRGSLLEDEPYESFQLTAYSPDFTVPEKYAGKVMYQIFPDRFAAAPGHGDKTGRRMHRDWGAQPEYENSPGRDYYAAEDFFGGNLKGIENALPRLSALGVGIIYLNPVFRAFSNHRYDTGDYMRIDPLLGTDGDFKDLCESAAQNGMSVLLDGVFSHTGSDSVYFNREGTYPGPGAYRSKDSEYFPWYRFRKFPDDYDCWWDIWSLPNVNETEKSYLEFITGRDGVARHWLKSGASGWRLDVADELPSEFLREFRRAVKEEKPDALIIGEVWEDASNKISYGRRREYLLGRELDSVMNYPFREAILGLLLGEFAPAQFVRRVLLLLSNYPPLVHSLLMNFLSTHDTVRVTTLLGGAPPPEALTRRQKAEFSLSPEARALALRRHALAAALLFLLPGIPCVYYGDELGLEGYDDPFNRGTYPKSPAFGGLYELYAFLGRLRNAKMSPLSGGGTEIFEKNGLLCLKRARGEEFIALAINPGVGERGLDFAAEFFGSGGVNCRLIGRGGVFGFESGEIPKTLGSLEGILCFSRGLTVEN